MDNLDRLKIRAMYANNDRQHNRMVRDKQRSLHRALLYSYQAAWIKKDSNPDTETYVRALINPDKIKFDYDEKILSTDFENNFHPGDTFEWPRASQTHWIILKQELTELAYFRGNIRRCQEIVATDPMTYEKYSQWAAIRGPVETALNTIQKSNIVADIPNLSLNIYVKNTEQNRRTFDRYCKFKFADKTWKVVTTDSISTPGILEFTAWEDYECDNDDIKSPIDPNPVIKPEDNLPEIKGDTFIKPLGVYRYQKINESGEWGVRLVAEKNKEIDDVLDYKILDGNILEIKWTAMVSGSFVISNGSVEKTIVVESLF